MSTETTPKIYVLIAAGGSGSRLGGETPKQYQKIHGKMLLTRTLQIFANSGLFDEIRVIIDPQHADWYHDAVKELEVGPHIAGGKERKNSVNNGLHAFSKANSKDIILIHDAARPFVTINEIERVVTAAKEHGAATLGTPVSDTIIDTHEKTYKDRKALYTLQTPQAFRFDLLKNAHEQSDDNQNWTDDTSMVAALGHEIHIVEGSRMNFKITREEDMEMARKILSPDKDTLIGQGFDVHAFDTETSGPVRLCGIDVPHDHKLKGHSDADVGLHAITDAILGAIAEGDIGQHFPPSDDTFKNMDSAVFLEQAVKLTSEKGGHINNIDLTLICEQPKIGPHTADMRKRIAKITGLNLARVNVKATTTEKLGFTGRKEGIAAQASVTVTM